MSAEQALVWAVGGAFALLVILTAVEWLRHRDRPRLWLAVSVVSLGLVACLDAAATGLQSQSGVITDILLVLFVLSGWALVEFRNDVLPLPRRFRIAAAVAVLVTIGALLAAFVPVPVSTKQITVLQAGASVLLLAVWGACVLEPVLSFWVHSGVLPAVQRDRLRALTLAYGGIILILAISVGTGLGGGGSRLSMATTSLALIIAPLFYVTFAPPRWLRRMWREREEERFRAALSELMYSPDLKTMAARASAWGARLVGAGGAVISSREPAVLGAYGFEPDAADAFWRTITTSLDAEDDAGVHVSGSMMRVPLQTQVPDAALTVSAGPLTPLFGEDELARLVEYGNVLASAMDRVVLFERLRRNAELLDLAYDAIVTWSLKNDRITYWNNAAEALYGWTAEEALGKEPQTLLYMDLDPRAAAMERLLQVGRWEGELEQVTKYGRVITVGARWALQRDAAGKPDLVIEINRDITESKVAAQQLRRARDEAERASQAKSEYLSRMSHELRTPLTAMLGYGDLLELRDPRPDQLEAIDAIQQASGHLLSLVNDVLDIARIESGRESLAPEAVSVAATVDECVRLVAPAAMDRGIKLSSDLGSAEGAYVRADRQRLVQSLLNLLSNAVKYAGEGASVTMRAEADAERVRLLVSDTGPGLTAEQQQRLFQPFERLGAERTTIQGTGLGLALTKKLVDAMDGTVGVETAPGQGSTFWIALERAPAEAVPEAQRIGTATVATPAHHTVLYVEDNLATISLMEQIFSMRPQVRLITAMQGGLTLDLAREHSPDAVILDLHLPDIPGDEVLRRLRADPRTSAIPVVMFSADATERQVKRLLAAGAAAYLTKPAKVQEFLRTLDEVLATPRAATG